MVLSKEKKTIEKEKIMMNNVNSNLYTKDNIKTLNIIDHIRLRPTAHIPNTGIHGQLAIIKEILDNSLDEMENFILDKGVINISIFHNKKRYIVIVEDNGRGVPIDKLYSSFTDSLTSGKFDNSVYRFSSGLFGLGSKSTIALSENVKIISKRTNRIGELTLNKNSIQNTTKIIDNVDNIQSGTIVIFEPDITIFSDTDKFISSKFEMLSDLIKKISIFCKFKINFKIFDGYQEIKKIFNFSYDEILTFLNRINNHQYTHAIYEFSSDEFDKESYIKDYFQIPNYHHELKIYKPLDISDLNDKMYLDIKIYIHLYSNTFLLNNKIKSLSLINNVNIDDDQSYHIKYLNQILKNKISKLIKDGDIKKFFIKQYKLPFFNLINIKFEGAEFSGTIKNSYKDVKFKKYYVNILNELITDSDINELYSVIKQHIEVRCNLAISKKIRQGNKKLLMDLKRPDKFSDCIIKGMEAELFLTEGDSAKTPEGREDNQAIYSLKGKLRNSVEDINSRNLSMKILLKNPIFQDIMTITGLSASTKDFSKLNFGKIFIMTDADPHGYHIANIIIGNLMILNSRILDAGMIYLTIPPLYSVSLKKSRQKIYIRSQEEFISTLSLKLYNKLFKLYISFDGSNFQETTNELFSYIIKIVFDIGELLEDISIKLNIPLLILEQLSYVSNILTKETLNLNILNKMFEKVRYDDFNNLLIISISNNDYILPLENINKIMYTEILPVLRKVKWNKFRLMIQSDNMSNTYISIGQLYLLCTSLNNLLTIERYKGIGSMPTKDKNITCMNRHTRTEYRISSIGDIAKIYQLLGRDSVFRKNI